MVYDVGVDLDVLFARRQYHGYKFLLSFELFLLISLISLTDK